MVFAIMLMIGLVALTVFAMMVALCTVLAASELSWREIFSKRLVDESKEYLKSMWSAKLFAFICFGIALVFAIPMHDALKKQEMARSGQCICECGACKANIKKVEQLMHMLNSSSNNVESTSKQDILQ